MTEDNEFEIVDRNNETIAVTSVDALDEEFGPDQTFADKLSDLSDHDLHLAVEELLKRSFKTAKRKLELLDESNSNLLMVSIQCQTSVNRDDFDAVKYGFRIYNYGGQDAVAETFDLVKSANVSANRYCEDRQNQPRKLLAAS